MDREQIINKLEELKRVANEYDDLDGAEALEIAIKLIEKGDYYART